MNRPVNAIAARVCGKPVSVAEVDSLEAAMRARTPVASLPLAGTSEGRQLRRWLTQLIVTERVVTAEAARLGVAAADAPSIDEVLTGVSGRHEIGSVAASALSAPLARALFAYVTADVTVHDEEVAAYHARNPRRFARGAPGSDGWRASHNGAVPPSLAQARPAIQAHLLAAARRGAFRDWLDARRADLVELAPGYEHPGDPRQPDNVHRH
jgi:[acyl-carrier-protein] S-malonyltransferase